MENTPLSMRLADPVEGAAGDLAVDVLILALDCEPLTAARQDDRFVRLFIGRKDDQVGRVRSGTVEPGEIGLPAKSSPIGLQVARGRVCHGVPSQGRRTVHDEGFLARRGIEMSGDCLGFDEVILVVPIGLERSVSRSDAPRLTDRSLTATAPSPMKTCSPWAGAGASRPAEASKRRDVTTNWACRAVSDPGGPGSPRSPARAGPR